MKEEAGRRRRKGVGRRREGGKEKEGERGSEKVSGKGKAKMSRDIVPCSQFSPIYLFFFSKSNSTPAPPFSFTLLLSSLPFHTPFSPLTSTLSLSLSLSPSLSPTHSVCFTPACRTSTSPSLMSMSVMF